MLSDKCGVFGERLKIGELIAETGGVYIAQGEADEFGFEAIQNSCGCCVRIIMDVRIEDFDLVLFYCGGDDQQPQRYHWRFPAS